jgi:hypothetical protein
MLIGITPFKYMMGSGYYCYFERGSMNFMFMALLSTSG